MIGFYEIKKSFNRLLFECSSITLPTKGIVDLIAPSGAGKTTLFNMIKGIDTAFEGEILVRGISTKKEMPQGIGYMSQNLNFVNNHTIKWHFDMACQKDKKKEKLRDCFIYRLRLDEILDIYPSELSNGERKRVGFALACLLDASILLLDEPFADLMEDDILQIREMIIEESANRLIIVSNHIVSYRFNENILALQNQEMIYQGKSDADEKLEKKTTRKNFWIRNSFSFWRFLYKALSMICLFLGIICIGYSNENVCLHEIKKNNIPIINVRQNASTQYYKQAEKMNLPFLTPCLASLDEVSLKEDETNMEPIYLIDDLKLSITENRGFCYQNQELVLSKNDVAVSDVWAKMHYQEYGLSSYQEMINFDLPILKCQIYKKGDDYNLTFDREITLFKKVKCLLDLKNQIFNQYFEKYEKSHSNEDYIKLKEYAKERNLSFVTFNEQVPIKNNSIYVFYENYKQLRKYINEVSKNTIYAYQDIVISEKLSKLNHVGQLSTFMMMSEDFKGPLIILFFSLAALLYLLFMKKQEKAEKKYFKFYNSLGFGKKEIYRRSELRVIIDTCLAATLVPLVTIPIMLKLNQLLLYVGSLSVLWSLLLVVTVDFIIQASFIRAMKKY